MKSSSSTPSHSTPIATTATKDTIDNFDYGTRYEQLLIDQRKLESIANDYLDKYYFPPTSNVSSSSSSSSSLPENGNNLESSSSSSSSNSNIRCSAIAASLSANRVAMMGMLQSAIHTSKKSSSSLATTSTSSNENKKDESIDGLICLWQHTLNQQRFGNDFHSINSNNKKNQRNINNPCLYLWTLDAIERSHQQNNIKRGEQKLHHSNDNDNNNNDDDDDEYNEEELEAEVNDFFAMNPEYQAYNKVQVYHIPSPQQESHISNSTHDNNESTSSSLSKKHKEHNHQIRNNMKTINASSSSSSSSTTTTTSSSAQVLNPYQPNTNNPNQQHTSYSSWDVYNAKHAQQHSSSTGNIITMTNTSKNNNHYSTNNLSNENMYNHSNSNMNYQAPYQPQPQQQQQPNQKKNPFCTAKELKQNDKIQIDDEYDNNSNNNINSSSNECQYNNYNNPYQQQHHHQQQLVHNPNRPTLSAGLKRKFQTPKLGSQNTNNNNNSNNNNTGNQPSSRLPSQQIVNNNANGSTSIKKKNNNSNNDDNNDDDLPEALKGLDKELIAKIENEIVDSGDPITFKDIAGLEDAKQTVMELVCWPMKRPDLFTGLRRGPNGLLLFGPPGTGKTLIGKAIAHESGATFFSISSSSLTSKWIGEGEKLVRTLFAVAAYKEPAVVFIDEIDSLLTQRKADENEASRRIKTEFLVQLDGTGTSGQGRVLAIGATNRPNELDDAARRRFVKRLYIPLPEQADRIILLNTLLSKNNHGLSDKEILKIASETNGFSGADLKALCTDASLGPIRELGIKALEIDANDVPPISYRHFKRSLRGMKPSVAESDLILYMDWNAKYGSKAITAEEYDGLSDDDASMGSNKSQ